MNDLNTPNPEWGNLEAGGQTPQYGARYNAPQHSEPPYNTSSAGVGGVPGGMPTYGTPAGAYAPQQQPMPPYNGNAYGAQTPQYVSPMNGNVRPQAPQYPQYPQYAPPAPQYAAQYAPQCVRRDPLPLPGCDFGQAIKRYWKGYARFSGRASRSEFWYAFLFQWIVGMGASIIPIIGPIVWGCVSLVPGLAIGVRRFHDQNLSGGLYAALYAVGTLASIPTLIGAFGFLAAYGSYDGPELPESGWWTIWMGVGSLMTLVYIIAIAVLMCRPSDPRGVRFDR